MAEKKLKKEKNARFFPARQDLKQGYNYQDWEKETGGSLR